jgi:flagellar motor switch protein FliG
VTNRPVDPESIPKSIQEILSKMDPAALKSLLASLPKEKVKPMLTEAMGYVKNMPQEEKEALRQLVSSFTQGKD